MLLKFLERFVISEKLREDLNRVEEQVNILTTRIETFENKLIRDRFDGHYQIWREKRVTAIIEHFGPLWFKGKKILELGCGFGDIGVMFSTLGADVTCCDARREHLDVINRIYPHLKTVQAGINKEWPFNSRFDLVLHLGVLYHLDNIDFSLVNTFACADYFVLETEVCDSSDKKIILKVEEDINGYDQSITGVGTRPSIPYLENILNENNCSFERITDRRCNSYFHQYDWKVENSNEWRHGLRAMWFCSIND